VLYSKLKSSGREFAIKMVDKNFVRRHNKIDEMMNEKKMLSLIDHPLCVKLHSTFQDEFSLCTLSSASACGYMRLSDSYSAQTTCWTWLCMASCSTLSSE